MVRMPYSPAKLTELVGKREEYCKKSLSLDTPLQMYWVRVTYRHSWILISKTVSTPTPSFSDYEIETIMFENSEILPKC